MCGALLLHMHWEDEDRLYDNGFRRGAHGVFEKKVGSKVFHISESTPGNFIFSVKTPDHFIPHTARPMAQVWELMEWADAVTDVPDRANHGSISQSAREAASNHELLASFAKS
jgi:hypothetical protein